MQILNTLLLAALAAPLVSSSHAHRRRERWQRQRDQPMPSDLPNHRAPWTGSTGNYTSGPGGSRPYAEPTSIKTVTMTIQPDTSSTSVAPTAAQPTTTSSPSIVRSSQQLSSSLSTSTTSPPQSSPTTASPASACPNEAYMPVNYTAMKPYFGMNVVNTKPFDPKGQPQGFRTEEDWQTAFKLLKDTFKNINAVRMYSTTDGDVHHLMRAIPAAQQNNLSILAGVWSGGLAYEGRFEKELQALEQVVDKYGCGNLAAVSVGNEDLNDINHYGIPNDNDVNAKKEATAKLLVKQMDEVRKLLRQKRCCNTPVTHTETWNELTNMDNPTVNKVIEACDQAVITNIFPYWGNVSVSKGPEVLAANSNHTMTAARQYGKDLWLGETSWAREQQGTWQNQYGATGDDAQDYFNIVGCQILRGDGSGFYYVDWDQDKPRVNTPIFGLFDFKGQPLLDFDCSKFQKEMYITDEMPGFVGGKGFSAGGSQ